MQNLRSQDTGQDDPNSDARELNFGDDDVVFIQQYSMPFAQNKASKAKPNILRKKCVTVPARISNTKNGVERSPVKSTASFIQEVVDDTEEYILDQSDFAPLLMNLEAVNGNLVDGETGVESIENLQKILVGQDQVQLINEPNKLFKRSENFVCRTCLSLTDGEECKKLFDKKCAKESEKLREKLVYIADEMNFKASFNAAVCQKCVKLIDITYEFKKQVKDVENRIKNKIKQNVSHSIVDLHSLLGGDDTTEVPQQNVRCYNYWDIDQDVKMGYLESGKSIRRIHNVQNMENTSTKTAKDAAGISREIVDGGLEKDNQSNASIISRRSKYRNLEEYLVARRDQLNKFRERYPARQRVYFKTSSGNLPLLKVPDFDRILSRKVKVPLEKSSECLDEVENSPVNDCMSNLEEVSVSAKNAGIENCDEIGRSENTGSNMGMYLARRQGRVKKFDYTNQFSNSSFRMLKNQRRPLDRDRALKVDETQAEGTQLSPGYLYLFNTGTTKKKPDVPKTWNLFDGEHDKYFENLVGEAGWFMVKKWSRFAARHRGIGDGPFLCEHCGFSTVSKSKFYRHMGTHKTEMMMCSYCGKLVKGGLHLKYHIEVKHMQPSYECKYCGKKFHLSINLSTHISRLHNGRNHMIQCQACGKFMKSWYLNNHMSRHNNKVFTCDICSKSYYCKSKLYRHKKKHSNERYPCSSCSKTYKSKSILKQHRLQIHERISEWSCEICDRLLSRKEHLKRHMKVVHGLDLLDNKQKPEVADEQDKECHEGIASLQVMDVNMSTTEQTENVVVYRNDEAESFYLF